MIRSHPRMAWLAAGLFALAALFCVPLGLRGRIAAVGGRTIRWRSPTAVSARAFDRDVAVHEIEAALDANDADLAQSFVDLAARSRRAAAGGAEEAGRSRRRRCQFRQRRRRQLRQRSDHRRAERHGGLRRHRARRSVRVRRYPRRGARRQPLRQRRELRPADPGARPCVGIAITAGTYATVGAAAPVAARAHRGQGGAQDRAAERAAGRMDRPLVARGDRLVGAEARRRLASPSRRSRCAPPARRSRSRRPDGLVRLVSDVGTVQAKAGTQAALDGLKLAEGPREMSRIATLAEKKGSKTRAILKTARPRRDPAVDRLVQSRVLGARRDPDAVRLRVVGQGRGRADDLPPSRPQEGARQARATP